MINIYNLKSCNDTYGHHCGYTLINTVAQTLRESTRTTDINACIGGDEFAVILRSITDSAHAYVKVQNLCDDVARSVSPTHRAVRHARPEWCCHTVAARLIRD